jgi:NAD(P)-dependent dehydrogenase (short-subunit alcohol dehydrogenase family)
VDSHGKEDLLQSEIDVGLKNNLFSNVYVINAFLGLIRKGEASQKKVIFITSQSGDIEFTRGTGFATLVGYSVSKIGMEMVITKYAAELAGEGIKFLSLAPGWVDTDAGKSRLRGSKRMGGWLT